VLQAGFHSEGKILAPEKESKKNENQIQEEDEQHCFSASKHKIN